jgi:hypothetical protein
MYFVKVSTKLFLSFIMLLPLCFFIPRAPSQRSWMSQVFIAMNITRGMPWFRREKDPGCAQFGSQFLNDPWVSQVNLFRRPSRLVCGGQSQSCGETESRLAGSLATKYLKIVSILYFRENALAGVFDIFLKGVEQARYRCLAEAPKRWLHHVAPCI